MNMNQLASVEAEGYSFTKEEIKFLNDLLESDISWDDKVKCIINKTKEEINENT